MTNLESSWAPVDELDVFLHLDPSNGGVHILMEFTGEQLNRALFSSNNILS